MPHDAAIVLSRPDFVLFASHGPPGRYEGRYSRATLAPTPRTKNRTVNVVGALGCSIDGAGGRRRREGIATFAQYRHRSLILLTTIRRKLVRLSSKKRGRANAREGRSAPISQEQGEESSN